MPDRALHFTLLQARNQGDPAREAEISCFAERLGLPPGRMRPVDVLRDPLDPGLYADTDVVLVGGAGEYSVLDDLPPIRRFVTFVAETAERGFPMFASCFGFQALVLGLGGEVIADPAHAEVGSYDLRLTAEGAADPLFGALPSPFVAQLGHKDRASRIPPDLRVLAESDRAPFQAARFVGAPVYATQFHPELTWLDNRRRFEHYMPTYGKLFGPEAARRQLDSHRPSPESNALLLRFAEMIAGSAR